MNRQLVWSYILLVAAAIAAFTVPVAFTLTYQLRGDVEELAHREAITAGILLAAGDRPSLVALKELADAYGEQTPGTLTVFDQEGRPVTAPRSAPVDESALEGAVATALRGETTETWDANVLMFGDGYTYSAPVRDAAGDVVGAVRVVYPAGTLNESLATIWGFRAVLAVVVLASAGVLGAMVARRLTRPLRELNDMAARLSGGDLTARVNISGPSETQQLGETLNVATATISSLLDSQREFIANASHQLRTPLTALKLSLENISDEVRDPQVVQDVERASSEVTRMSAIVTGLLQLARAEGRAARWEQVDLATLIAARVRTWHASAAERGVSIHCDETPPTPVHVRPGSLEQVFDNVLANALAVSPRGGCITLSTRTSSRSVTVSVADEGSGLSPEDRARAFERFWRGPAKTGPVGSGLGLAIVAQLMSDNQGRASLNEAPGGGLQVDLSLPR